MKISVVMPVFNTRETYLYQAIDSVLMQKQSWHEFIIVDDGSTHEETIAMLEKASSYFETGEVGSARVIHQENKKISGALNTGIRNMTGDWWAGCGSDDIWYPDKLKEQVDFINKHPYAKAIYCDWDYIDRNGKKTGNYQEPGFSSRMEAGEYIIRNYFGMWSGMMVHRDVFDSVGLFNETYPTREDYEMNIRILTKFMMYRVPKTLCGYRLHPGQLTQTNEKESQNKYLEMGRALAIEHFGDK